MKKSLLFALVCCILMVSCKKEETVVRSKSNLHPSQFVSVNTEGKKTQLYTLTNDNGMEVCLTNLGMRIISIMVPDKNGELKDVVLGYDNIEPYKDINNYFGACIGRYANRIANGRFQLDRVNYELQRNAGSNNILHGGSVGFHTKHFTIIEEETNSITANYLSPAKEAGFPGEVLATVSYRLTNDNCLVIDYNATCNIPTVVNLTNHSYFNLSGDLSQSIIDHQLFIDADKYTVVDEELIPTGEIKTVKDSGLDFTNSTVIGGRVADDAYDLNYVLNYPDSIENLAAKVYSPQSGIFMEVYTTEPGIQFYTATGLNVTGKGGVVYGNNSALCLETQHFPDSPNHPEFPSTTLRPGEILVSKTIYKFGVIKE